MALAKGKPFVKPDVLVLDFDGVVCESMDECLLMTWNGALGKPVSDFRAAGLSAIPSAFIERFKRYRPYARHLGHFLLAWHEASPITNQQEFDAAYQSLQQETIEAFIEKVSTYRQRVREERMTHWIQQHHLFPESVSLLRARSEFPYIVTARDGDSVCAILASVAISCDRARIFGEQRSKIDALYTIARNEERDTSHILFIDDNVYNVRDARLAGFNAHWALWGYHAPDHIAVARTYHLPMVSLETFSLRTPIEIRKTEETSEFNH